MNLFSSQQRKKVAHDPDNLARQAIFRIRNFIVLGQMISNRQTLYTLTFTNVTRLSVVTIAILIFSKTLIQPSDLLKKKTKGGSRNVF